MVMAGMFSPSEINQDVLNFALQGSERKSSQPVDLAGIYSAQSGITGQGLQGQFEDPRQQPVAPPIRRAADVLREEEMKKILGTP